MTDVVPLLEACGLGKTFPARGALRHRPRGQVRAVTDVDLEVHAGETVSVIGESGCGKTTLARLVLLLDRPTTGSVRFEGADVAAFDRTGRRSYRQAVQAVLQDPYSSLPPRMRIRDAVAEPLRVLRRATRGEGRRRAAELLERVGLDPDLHGPRYPHELSGGQLQRVAIARALAPSPRLLVLDEPVSALDVSVKAQVMNLLADLQDDLGLAYLLISHDLAGVGFLSDRVYVMYLGRVMEAGATAPVFDGPRHPYTQALLAAAVSTDDLVADEIPVLEGELPSPLDPPAGCAFHTRCPEVHEPCASRRPPLEAHEGRLVACHLLSRPPVGDRANGGGHQRPTTTEVNDATT